MKTTNKIAIILSMIFLSGNSFAQTSSNGSKIAEDQRVPETSLQLVFNMVNTNLNYGKSNSSLGSYKKSIFGPQAGVSFQAGVTPKFSVVTQMYFMMKGGKLDANNPLTFSKTSLRLYTLESPLLARFHLGKFYVNAGPAIFYNLGGKQKIADDTEKISFNSDDEFSFRRAAAAVQIGAGYTFNMKHRKAAIDIRYSYGVTSISQNHDMFDRYLNVNLHIYNPWKTNPFARKRK